MDMLQPLMVSVIDDGEDDEDDADEDEDEDEDDADADAEGCLVDFGGGDADKHPDCDFLDSDDGYDGSDDICTGDVIDTSWSCPHRKFARPLHPKPNDILATSVPNPYPR